MRVMRLAGLVAVIAALAAPAAGAGTHLPSGFHEDVVAGGLQRPTAFTFLPDGGILIAEQQGVVRLVRDGRLRFRPFLDIRPRVNTFNERGLMAIAVHHGRLYAFYAAETNPEQPREPTGMRLSRFAIEGGHAPAASEVVVLGRASREGCNGALARADCIPANCGCHVGGDIQFADDGTLFLSTGDAANAGQTNDNAFRAQDADSLAGKVLHIEANGDGLPSNPFWTGKPDDNRSKVWALGLRNPFRFELHPRSRLPYVGDVGWDEWEELDVVRRGANLGWPCWEGAPAQPRYARRPECRELYERKPDVEPPLLAYRRSRGGAGIIGGAFLRDPPYPARYRGAYFFADFVRGWIRYVPDAIGQERAHAAPPFATGADGPVDLEVGPAGDVYYLALEAGELRRIEFRGGLAPPGSGSAVALARDLIASLF